MSRRTQPSAPTRPPTLHAPLGLLAAGFAMDAYDLFALNGVLVIWGLSPDTTPNTTEKSLLTAMALVGAVIGQVVFGFVGDVCGHGRPFLMTLTLMLCGTLVSAVLPTGSGSTSHAGFFAGLIVARLVMGIGIGGEYPLSVVISSRLEMTRNETKAEKLSTVFMLQGVGIIIAVTMCYALFMACSNDVAWRLVLGLGAVFSLLLGAMRFYFLRDFICPPPPHDAVSTHVEEAVGNADVDSGADGDDEVDGAEADADSNGNRSGGCAECACAFGCVCSCLNMNGNALPAVNRTAARPPITTVPATAQTVVVASGEHKSSGNDSDPAAPAARVASAHRLHQQRHQHPPLMGCGALWKVIASDRVVGYRLIGTCVNWFLLDVVFYANGLFSATLLNHFTNNDAERTLRYNLFLGLIGFPGYLFAVYLIKSRKVSRRLHQSVTFVLLGGMYFVCAFALDEMENNLSVLLVLYGLTFFLSNAGPNTTTYVLSGESFPQEVRTSCSGLSAAAGKIGAAVSAYGMAPLAAQSLEAVFVTCGCISVVGAITTLIFTASQTELDKLNPIEFCEPQPPTDLEYGAAAKSTPPQGVVSFLTPNNARLALRAVPRVASETASLGLSPRIAVCIGAPAALRGPDSHPNLIHAQAPNSNSNGIKQTAAIELSPSFQPIG